MRVATVPKAVIKPTAAPRRAASFAGRNAGAMIRRPRATAQLTVEATHESHNLTDGPANVSVTFTLNRKVNFGQQIVLVGSAEPLGSWDLGRAPHMTWTEGDVWTATLELPAGAELEYKFALTEPHKAAMWETCPNRAFSVPTATVVSCTWDEPNATTWEPAAGAEAFSDVIDSPPPAFRPAKVLASYDSHQGHAGEEEEAANGKVHTAVLSVDQNGTAGTDVAYSPEQLDFLKRKLETIQVQPRPAAVKQSAAAASSSGTYSEEQLEFLRRAGKLRGDEVAQPKVAPQGAHSRSSSPAPPASNGQYSAEQLEFLRRAGKLPGGSAAAPAPAVHAASASPSPAGHAAGDQYSPEQLEFLRRAGKVPSPAPAQPARAAAAASRSPAPLGQQAAAGTQYSAEQLEFLRRSGKLNGSASPSPAPAHQSNGRVGGSAAQYSPEQLEFLRRAGKL